MVVGNCSLVPAPIVAPLTLRQYDNQMNRQTSDFWATGRKDAAPT